MNKKQAYKADNESYLLRIAQEPGVKALPCGILYKVLKTGNGISPTASSVVSIYYKGMLINGRVFDDNTQQGYPDAFRLTDLIRGWQIALPQMHIGDKWCIYIPSEQGYGAITTDGIPKNSTLIFEIELVGIM